MYNYLFIKLLCILDFYFELGICMKNFKFATLNLEKYIIQTLTMNRLEELTRYKVDNK